MDALIDKKIMNFGWPDQPTWLSCSLLPVLLANSHKSIKCIQNRRQLQGIRQCLGDFILLVD